MAGWSNDNAGPKGKEWGAIERLCGQFEDAWRLGGEPKAEEHLGAVEGPVREYLLRQLLYLECEYRARRGEAIDVEGLLARFPSDESLVREVVNAVCSASRDTRRTNDDESRCADATIGLMGSVEDHDTKGLRRRIGEYDVLEEIARGGMGIVYKVRHRKLRRIAALKMILAGHFASDAEVQRFYSEATTAAQLDHPGIVPVFEVGEHGGEHYFTMGYVEGSSLAKRVAHGPLPPRVAATIVAELADAVAYAHEKGVIHRDLKPQNVLLGADDRPRITDFGLAKVVHTDSSLTASGQVLGTPSYMPPEQARGDRSEIGPHSDIYSLGAILYCLLIGKPPFQAGTPIDTLRMVMEREPRRPRQQVPAVDVDLETICLKCLAKEPRQRYASAQGLAEDLRRYLRNEPILARPTGRLVRGWRWCRRKPVAAGLCVSLVAVFISLAIMAHLTRKTHRAVDVVKLNRQIGTALETPELTEGYLQEVETLINQLADYDVNQANVARNRLRDGFAKRIRQSMLSRRLAEQDVAVVKAAIDMLAQRDPDTARTLRELLESRQFDWQEVFRLEGSFEELETVWPQGWFAIVDDSLELRRTTELVSESQFLPTQIPSQGDVALEAVFPVGWSQADRMGLAVHTEQSESVSQAGYHFVVTRIPTGESGDSQRRPVLQAEIWRDGTRLRFSALPVEELEDQPLHLRAERNGDRLIMQINDLEPVVVEELFAAGGGGSGYFAVEMPANLKLRQLIGFTKARGRAATAMERGDELLAAGKLTEAYQAYIEQANTTDDRQLQLEARFKQALSLMRLKRLDDARPLLESLVSEASARWSLLASCQLWLLELEEGDVEEADRIYEAISFQYKFEELAVRLPIESRRRIIAAYNEGVGGGLDATRPHPLRVQRLERLVKVQRLLDAPMRTQISAKLRLMEAYHWEEQLDQAEQTGRELLAEPRLSTQQECEILRRLTWILIARDKPLDVLTELDRRLCEEDSDKIRVAYAPLLIEKARVLAASGDFSEAHRCMQKLSKSNAEITVGNYIEAALVGGFILEQLGRTEDARRCWQNGFQVARERNRLGLLAATMLGSLTNSYTRDDARGTLAGVISGNADSPVISFLQRRLVPDQLLHGMLQNMWQEPQARDWARRYALRKVTAAEADYKQMHFAANEIWRQCVAGTTELTPPVSPEQQQVISQLTELLWQAWLDNEVTERHIVQAAMTYRGAFNIFGWSGLSPSLDPVLRAHFAYVFGCRYQHLGRSEEARKLFEDAVRDAPPASPIKSLAEQELAQLGAVDSSHSP